MHRDELHHSPTCFPDLWRSEHEVVASVDIRFTVNDTDSELIQIYGCARENNWAF